MIDLIPAETLRATIRPGYAAGDPRWLVLYKHMAERVQRWESVGSGRGEFLSNTSGINLWDFSLLDSPRTACVNLAELFRWVGTDTERGQFLACCGIKKWGDLAKPIRVKGWSPKEFGKALWFDVTARTLCKPGPNESHPDALWVESGGLRVNSWGRWQHELYYGYPHDPGWVVALKQGAGESREGFAARTDRWLSGMLEPEHDPRMRSYRERARNRAYEAAKTLFYPHFGDRDILPEVADRLSQHDIAGVEAYCIRLTPARRKTLLRWAEAP